MGSFCATSRIVAYSSIDRPWSVTAFFMASLASSTRRSFSAAGAWASFCSKVPLTVDTCLTAAAAASSFLSGIVVGAGLGAVAGGAEGGCCCAFAAGMNRRPAAARVIAQNAPSLVVDCMSNLLFWMSFPLHDSRPSQTIRHEPRLCSHDEQQHPPPATFDTRPARKNAIHC